MLQIDPHELERKRSLARKMLVDSGCLDPTDEEIDEVVAGAYRRLMHQQQKEQEEEEQANYNDEDNEDDNDDDEGENNKKHSSPSPQQQQQNQQQQNYQHKHTSVGARVSDFADGQTPPQHYALPAFPDYQQGPQGQGQQKPSVYQARTQQQQQQQQQQQNKKLPLHQRRFEPIVNMEKENNHHHHQQQQHFQQQQQQQQQPHYQQPPHQPSELPTKEAELQRLNRAAVNYTLLGLSSKVFAAVGNRIEHCEKSVLKQGRPVTRIAGSTLPARAKTDPVARGAQLRQKWDREEEGVKKNRKQLTWDVRQSMLM